MYSIKCDVKDDGGRDTIKRAKGIGRSVVERMGHDAYQQAYREHTESTVDMTILRSIQHTVHTITFKKRGLCCWDDKRVWIGKNSSVPHGSVLSPVQYDGPVRVRPPKHGDVWSDDDDEVQSTGVRAVARRDERAGEPAVVVARRDERAGEPAVVVARRDERAGEPAVVVARRVVDRAVARSDVEESDGGVVEESDESDVEEEERGDAVGFDDEERSEDESENEEDRMFVDDAEVDEEWRPLRARVRLPESDDEDDGLSVVARLAKRCRFR